MPNSSLLQNRSNRVKELAQAAGFAFVGISEARQLDDEARRLEAWLQQGLHGRMQYMENHFDKRIDPRKLVDGAKSVISLLFNYHNPAKQTDPEAPRISQYAYGEDYHHILKKKLNTLLDSMRIEMGDIHGRCFVDSAPVMERDWAKHSGLGWVGKHTLLIHPKAGSWFFLAEIICDLELSPDTAIRDHCGRCRRCIDACPTQAISPQGYLVDATRCISYLTIELKEELPASFSSQMDNWMFGCDVCQDVCPWNRFSKPHQEEKFHPNPELLSKTKQEWVELTEEVFQTIFTKSAVKRTKYEGLKRNIRFIT